MAVKRMTDYTDVDSIVNTVKDLTDDYIKGSYRYDEILGRQLEEVISLAKAIKKDKKLCAGIRANLRDVQDMLEWDNFHTTNRAIDIIFNPKDFQTYLKSAAQSYIDDLR